MLRVNIDDSDRVARHASLVQKYSRNPEIVLWSRFPKGCCDALVPCQQASPGDR